MDRTRLLNRDSEALSGGWVEEVFQILKVEHRFDMPGVRNREPETEC